MIISQLDATPCDTLIIGAGPAGLAVGAALKQVGRGSIILEQGNAVGVAWRGHYERLHLHTAKAHSGLPFLPFPKDFPRYPSRLQVVNYLEAYARHFELQPRFGQRVVAAQPVNGGWDVQTQDARYQAANLVIATGSNREPNLPSWPGQAAYRGVVMHSSQYKNGAAFKNQKVLVVGFGNSGGEIALDLWEQGAQPSLSVRSPVNVIPRDLFGIPIQTIAILQSKLPPRLADAVNAPVLRGVQGDLTRYGLRKLPHGAMTQIQGQARIPLIDVGTLALIKRGQVSICAGIESFTADGVRFSDGALRPFDGVILATGYRARVNAFLEGAATTHDETGTPLTSGRETRLSGLYFCGYRTVSTGVLREIGIEARRIGAAIGWK